MKIPQPGDHKYDFSQYNSFKVFEHLYDNLSADEMSEIETPDYNKSSGSLYKILSAFLLVVLIALLAHPLLAYFLKTPYPLIVISDNHSTPLLKRGDIILSKGVINFQSLQPSDLVVSYYTPSVNQKTFSVLKVKQVLSDHLILTNITDSVSEKSIGKKNISGVVIGNQQPWRLPRLGYLILWWSDVVGFLGLRK